MSEPLNQRVAAEVNQILKLADWLERPEAGTRLRDEAQLWRAKETTIVVAAEPNRGKSSLVNSLLGRTVLPIGTDLATTTTHVVVRHGDPESARVHLVGRADPIEVGLDEVGAWIVGEGTAEGSVRGVELRLDHPLLAAGLALVDTPGVGGLDAAHGRITLAALRRADAMLFVVDAGAPISEPELAFLQEAADRIEAVAVAVTKIDRFRGWRTIVEDDRAALGRRTPRFATAPVFPTSARLRELADQAATGGVPAEALLDESGVPALERFVADGVIARVALLRLANLLRVSDATLSGLADQWTTMLAAATDESGARDAAAELQRDLERLREHSEASLILVTDRCNAMRERLGVELGRALKEISASFEAGSEPKQTAAQLVDSVEAELGAVDARLAEQIDLEVEDIRSQVEAMFDDPTFAFPRFEGERDPVALEFRVPPTLAPKADADPSAKLRMASVAVATSSGSFLLYSGIADASTYPLLMGTSMLVGALTTLTGLRSSRKQRDLADARRQLAEVVEQARNELSPRLRQRVLELQRATEAEVKAYVRRRTKELQDAVAEANALARSDAAARQQAQAEAQQRLDLIDRHRDAVAALASEVQSFSSSVAPPGATAS